MREREKTPQLVGRALKERLLVELLPHVPVALVVATRAVSPVEVALAEELQALGRESPRAVSVPPLAARGGPRLPVLLASSSSQLVYPWWKVQLLVVRTPRR